MNKWYFKTWFIVLLFILGIWLFFPAIAAIVLLIMRSSKKKKLQHLNDNKIVNKNTDDESIKNYELFDDIVDESILKYKYEESICLDENAIDIVTGHGGEELNFIPEPNNEFDEKAVAIYLHNTKIGYVYKGKIKDMLNDWISRNEIYIGYVNKIFKCENKVTYKIGFYKPMETFESRTFTLVKTNKKIDEDTRRIDNLMYMNEGDPVQIEYNHETYSYIVFDEHYDEIGELPESADNFIESNNVIGIVSSLEETDNGKPKAQVTVYKI